MKKIHTLLIISTITSLSACASYKVTYKFEGEESSPIINFTSDYPNHTSLSANITDTTDNKCRNLEAVGYILKGSHMPFSTDEVNTLVSFKVPENKPVIINAWAMITATASTRTVCGPIAFRFTPLAGKTYAINFTDGGKSCRMPVTTNDGEPVEGTYLSQCK
jgi:hypothetical protein